MNSTGKFFLSRWLWVVFALFLLTPVSSKAASNFSPSELDTLVSTIALYPDPLLVHVLAASTYGDQISGANDWAQAHKNQSGEELAREMERAELPYDPSVQALIPFPTVLATMAKYRTWSDQLGDAVSVQKDDVMDAIQRLRNAAYDHGQLKTDEQVRVEKGTSIIIEPIRTEYVYVPVYNPRVVFYVYADYPSIRYHHHAWLGPWYGEWGWGSCWFEWDNHFMFVRDYRWYHHRPIPRHPRRYNPPPRRLEPMGGHRTPRPRFESAWDNPQGYKPVSNEPSGQRKQRSVEFRPIPKKENPVAPAGGVVRIPGEKNGSSGTVKSGSTTPPPGWNPPPRKDDEQSSEKREDNRYPESGRSDSRKTFTPNVLPNGGNGGFSKSKRR